MPKVPRSDAFVPRGAPQVYGRRGARPCLAGNPNGWCLPIIVHVRGATSPRAPRRRIRVTARYVGTRSLRLVEETRDARESPVSPASRRVRARDDGGLDHRARRARLRDHRDLQLHRSGADLDRPPLGHRGDLRPLRGAGRPDWRVFATRDSAAERRRRFPSPPRDSIEVNVGGQGSFTGGGFNGGGSGTIQRRRRSLGHPHRRLRGSPTACSSRAGVAEMVAAAMPNGTADGGGGGGPVGEDAADPAHCLANISGVAGGGGTTHGREAPLPRRRQVHSATVVTRRAPAPRPAAAAAAGGAAAPASAVARGGGSGHGPDGTTFQTGIRMGDGLVTVTYAEPSIAHPDPLGRGPRPAALDREQPADAPQRRAAGPSTLAIPPGPAPSSPRSSTRSSSSGAGRSTPTTPML